MSTQIHVSAKDKTPADTVLPSRLSAGTRHARRWSRPGNPATSRFKVKPRSACGSEGLQLASYLGGRGGEGEGRRLGLRCDSATLQQPVRDSLPSLPPLPAPLPAPHREVTVPAPARCACHCEPCVCL